MRNGGLDMNKWSYWIKLGFRYSLIIIMASIIYGSFMNIMTGTFTLSVTLSTTLGYGTAMSSILLLILNMSNNIFLAKLAISMGETRKNCHTGMNVMNITFILINIIAITMLSIFTGNLSLDFCTQLFMIACVYLLAIGCGMCTGCANKTLSINFTAIQVALMIVSIIVVLCVSIYAATLLNGNLYLEDRIAPISFILIMNILILVLGVGLYVTGNCLMRKRIMTLEVQF